MLLNYWIISTGDNLIASKNWIRTWNYFYELEKLPKKEEQIQSGQIGKSTGVTKIHCTVTALFGSAAIP